MTTTEQVDQVDEEAAMVRRYITPGDPQRDDKPQVSEALAAVLAAQSQLAEQHAALKERERDLRVELLPDDERARLGQIWREIRDGTLDLEPEIPVTPCPDWCEAEKHAGEGKHHEGAVGRVEGRAWVPNADFKKWADLYVHDDPDQGPTINVFADVDLEANTARQFAAHLLRAADLYDRLTSKSVSPTL